MAKTKTSFKKGQSGNPHGAPRKYETYREVFEQLGQADRVYLNIETTVIVDGQKKTQKKVIDIKLGKDGKENAPTIKKAVAAVAAQKTLSGDKEWAKLLIEHTNGRPTQPLEHSGNVAHDHFISSILEIDGNDGSNKK